MAEIRSAVELVEKMARDAKAASRELAKADTGTKNRALLEIAKGLELHTDDILKVNGRDIELAKKKGISSALLDRLRLTEGRIGSMISGLRDLAALPDPVGEILGMTTRPNGLQIGRVRVPLGVIGIVYESRPNVTIDATGICLKSGNAVILRGGSEAIGSNGLLAGIVSDSLETVGLPGASVSLVPTTDREAVTALARQKGLVDLIIARGGGTLMHVLSEAATVPLVEHGGGVCHVYIHRAADVAKAVTIAVNAKVSRPGVCNSAETFLIDREIAGQVLPPLVAELKAKGVEVRGCPGVGNIVADVVPATEDDWSAEYLDLIVSIKLVNDLDEAVEHINNYSTHHSDAIVTEDYSSSRRFLRDVDSAAVYVNASTRFTDGYEFGLGAEIGISTQKLHARGPMGLAELTCGKFIILGDGQIRL